MVLTHIHSSPSSFAAQRVGEHRITLGWMRMLSAQRSLPLLQDPFPSWHRRGLPGRVDNAEQLVRTDAAEDGTDGFFVATFQKQVTPTKL